MSDFHEEEDTCRICSTPGTDEQPLFHPCKCSGTIRYIHQDCLTTWLAHSKKRKCDLCNHPFSFTKVYAPNMPPTLPVPLLLRRLAQQIFYGILFGVRSVLVATIWLAVLPWLTLLAWRFYFAMGEATAWWISNRPRTDPGEVGSPFYYVVSMNSSSLPPLSFLDWVTTHPLWHDLPADIFTGQIIASLIVLTFVAVFLLREWISQNARPGVFEDDDLPAEDQPAAPRAAVVPQPQPQQPLQQPRPVVPDPPRVPDQQQAVPQRRPIIRRHFDEGHRVGEERRRRSPVELHRREKGKARQLDGIEELDPRTRRRMRLKERGGKSREQAEAYSRRVYEARVARRHAPKLDTTALENAARAHTSPGGLAPSTFQFAFQPPRPSSSSEQEEVGSTNSNERPEQPAPTYSNQGKWKEAESLQMEARKEKLGAQDDIEREVAPMHDDLEGSSTSSSSTPGPEGDLLDDSPAVIVEEFPPGMSEELSDESMQDSDLEYSFLGSRQTLLDDSEAEAGPSGLNQGLPQHILDGGQGTSKDITATIRAAMDADPDTSDTQSEPDLDDERDRYFAAPEEEQRGEVEADVIVAENDDQEGAEEMPLQAGPPIDHPVDGDDNDQDQVVPKNEDGIEEDGNRGQGQVVDAVQEAAPARVALNQNVVAVDIEQAVAAAQPAGGPDANDEMDGNGDDDMEGVMEAIGLRGPIWGIFQNAALMVFILDTAIGVGVWIPFTLGKSAALLFLDPHRALQLLHLPIRAIRIITDPVVDYVIYLIVELFSQLAYLAFSINLFIVGLVLGSNGQEKASAAMVGMRNRSQVFLNAPWERLIEVVFRDSKQPDAQPGAINSRSSFITTYLTDISLKAEPYFAVLGKEVRLSAERVKESWLNLALCHGPMERLFAVSLGYVIIGLSVAVYLNLLTVGTARSAGRAVRSAVRQQLLVLKVAAFILIELVTFPFGCGIVLDLSTIWLFPEANLQSRMAFFAQAPLTAIFYHWIAGTLFMYAFAVLLSGCRTVMRPGAMWFIKDPQDQNSHPIRDILDRPALTQLRKIGISAIMYSAMVVCVVGSVAGLLVIGDKSIMPFRWKNREPLSHVPVDLLFLHLLLPYTMRYFRPKKVVKKFATAIWKFLAAKLRLTSYFFGGRHHSEEYTPKTWREVFMRTPDDLADAEHVFDGSFRRVPATDQIALPRDMKATVPVTEVGEPVNEEARNLMRMQDVEATKAQRDVNKDYMVVYIPPHFRYRILCFIGLMWCICAMLLGLAVALPIQFGRTFFKLFTPREVHDGYSLIVGFYLLWVCYIIGREVDRLDKRRQRQGNEGPRADLRIFAIKRGLLWCVKTIYMVLFLGVIVPTLVALVVDLYIVVPLRLTLKPDMVPRIRIIDSWALGLLYAKIALHVHRIHPPNQITRGLQRIMENGWSHPDPVTATKEVIAPLVAGLLGMITIPGALFKFAYVFFPNADFDGKFVFMHIYPGIFVFAGLMRSAVVLYDILSTWSQTIRDKEFLVEMRLLNHEADKQKDIVPAAVQGAHVEA
ncbi:hypothetical protein M378DRAFT_518862 [Amanita muscaria Koide BX008]|uniref:RING-type E3 ubiquitin transferase n=1 Tax=Amanita muscaria (strain Koide BX008) TaxID=946122 RepID=A0A0C2WV15_AMAMK|nr:hypothetical protein M378DRAFT_518862 [Amanita muscaria Koide BX008]